MIEILIVLGLAWILAAITQDLKSREVANWTNFSLIIFALVVRLFYSVFASDYSYFLFGLFGLGIFYVLAHLFYFVKLFAGGDAKLMIALGAIIPFASTFYENTLILFVFTFSLLVAGALYSIVYSGVLVLQNKKAYQKEFRKVFENNKGIVFFCFFVAILLLLIPLFSGFYEFVFIPLIVIIFPFLYIYLKAVENACLIRRVSIDNLTIGDWLVKDIKVKNKVIEAKWDGLQENELRYLKRNYDKKVLVRYGIPFTPSFLIAFLVIIAIKYLGNSDWGFWQFF